MRKPLLAANWKMNPVTGATALELARAVSPAAAEHAGQVEVAVFPPFCFLESVAAALVDAPVGLGAQDCYWERSGAFTGEVSAAMLAGWCDWVIVGHSERRGYFGETDEQVARKAAAALEAGLSVIVAIGEREAELEAGETDLVCSRQLGAVLEVLTAADADRLVIAYEPVWAIGTGRNADPAHAGATMEVVRRRLDGAFGTEAAGRVRVLYGGSTNAANVVSYVELASCDGCLVGGASLKAEEFSSMIGAVASVEARQAIRPAPPDPPTGEGGRGIRPAPPDPPTGEGGK
ncbi:MAG TPA: triose-phosphate isomerase [Terriglobales bacterium]|nr:triose-phosphate isomerase [Terriglobales bacterium]